MPRMRPCGLKVYGGGRFGEAGGVQKALCLFPGANTGSERAEMGHRRGNERLSWMNST